MALNLGNLIVNLSVNASKMNRGLTVAESRLKQFDQRATMVGQGMKNLGFQMTAFISLPILGVGIAAVKAASDMEVLQIQLDSLLGSATKGTKLLEQIKEFSAGTPFQIGDIGKATRILLAFGRPLENIKEELKSIGDIAAGTGIPIAALAKIFAKTIEKGRLLQEELQQIGERGAPISQAIADVLGVAKSEVVELTRKGKISSEVLVKAFKLLSGEGGKFENLMAKMSNTMVGLWSNVKDNVTLLLVEFGDMIVQTLELKKVFKGIIAELENAKRAFQDMDANTKKAIVTMIAVVGSIGPILLALGTLILAIKGVIAIILVLKTVLLATLFNPMVIGIVAVIAIIGSMIAIFIQLQGTGETFFEKMESLLGNDILNWEHWAKTVSSFLLIIASNAMKLWANVKAGFQQFANDLELFFTFVFAAASGNFDKDAFKEQVAELGHKSAEIERKRKAAILEAEELLKITLPGAPKKEPDKPPIEPDKEVKGIIKKFASIAKIGSLEEFRIRNKIPLEKDKNVAANEATAKNTKEVKDAIDKTNTILSQINKPPAGIQP